MITGTIMAALVVIGMNFAFALIRKKTGDLERTRKIMKESDEWREQYTEALRKGENSRVDELKKKLPYIKKMTMEMQQTQLRPMLIFMIPSILLWWCVFPAFFGETVALSPIEIPWITCSDQNVITDKEIDKNGEPRGPCSVPGEVYTTWWFTISSLAVYIIIAKVTRTSLEK